MKKFILSALLLLVGFVHSYTFAQKNYNTGLGLRFGYVYGVTLKHFINDKWAIEGILSTRGWGNGSGFNLAVLGEHHWALGPKGLALYAGFGGHLGYWSWKNGNRPNGYNNNQAFVLGVDGILGLEYTLAAAPFTFALDWKPEFDLIGGSRFWGDGVALSIRYAFK